MFHALLENTVQPQVFLFLLEHAQLVISVFKVQLLQLQLAALMQIDVQLAIIVLQELQSKFLVILEVIVQQLV